MPRAVPLALLRRRRVLTQRQLAERAGITHATVVALEKGRGRPQATTMRKVAAALDVEPSDVAEFRRAIESEPEQLGLGA